MNKKGFTLFELLAVLLVIIFAFFLAIPIVKNVIKNSKYDSFKNSALNVIDAVDFFIADNKFIQIPEDGIEIQYLDESILKNNDFDEGKVLRNVDGQTEIVYLMDGDFCATGIKTKLKTSNKGCGALDKTSPTKANLFLKNSTKNNLTIIAAGYDEDSKIVKYEISVDNGKYYTNKNKKNNVFEIKIKDSKEHDFKVRITNEAGLQKESETKKFKVENTGILCSEITNKEYIQSKKTINCKTSNDYEYEYSKDLTSWYPLKDDFNINFDNNDIIHLRAKNESSIISTNTINVNNIDTTLNGAYPILDNNMIPVIYVENKGWVIANKNIKYWDYDNKIWANAVFVRKDKDENDPSSHSRNYYLNNDSINEVIYEKDILAFYVWIPKFKYKLWNITGISKEPKEIEIQFENSNNKSTGLKNGITTNNEWITHNAFLYEDNKNGFWINKYEVSVNQNTNCYLTNSIDSCNKTDFEIYSLPNKNSLKNISISNVYILSNLLTKKFNSYGISNMESHLTTNLEWGAVTYLTHSKYGENNDTTTGNITGVYGMNNNQEFVMGNYNKDNGLDDSNNSGFNDNWPNVYIDYYNSTSSKGKILGDATLETEGWYSAINNFINGSNPFFIRGINNMFSFDKSSGSANIDTTFRTILINKKV